MSTVIEVFKTFDQKLLSLMWVFIYKFDLARFLIRYKTRLIVREDLKEVTTENVYVSTLTIKIFRCLIILTFAFDLQTRQFNVINVFLNVKINRVIHVYISNDFVINEKCLLLIRVLYEFRKSSLLWLREFIQILISLNMQQIFDEFCLFIDYQNIILFFYVNDIVIIFRSFRASNVKRLVQRLNARFELKNMSELKFFLDVRIIRDDRDIYLCQDSYMNNLTIEYLIDAFKTLSFSLSSNFIVLISNHSKSNSNSNSSIMNFFLRKKYRKKIDSIYYSANITRSDVAKAIFKLVEHLINLELEHLHAINHCFQYWYETKYLVIKYSLSKDEKLTIQSFNHDRNHDFDHDHDRDQILSTKNKHVFENIIDVSFANSLERRSYERFTFKLYDDMIDWVARKQATISTFIIEIELLTLLHVDKTCIWWINFFEKLSFDYDHEIKIYNDNIQIIRILISKQLKIMTKLLHVNITQL
jgi:hypothetical protein